MAYWARVGALPVALILMLVAVAADDAPGLSNGDVAHALNDGVGNLGAAVIKAVAGPFGGVFDQFFAGEVEGGELFHWVRDLLGLLRVACSRWRNIGGGYGRYKLWIVGRISRGDSAGADPGQWPSGSDAIKDLLRSPRSPYIALAKPGRQKERLGPSKKAYWSWLQTPRLVASTAPRLYADHTEEHP